MAAARATKVLGNRCERPKSATRKGTQARATGCSRLSPGDVPLWAAGTISAGELGDRFPIAADATNRVNWRQWTHNLRCYGLELNLPRCLDSSGERPILVC